MLSVMLLLFGILTFVYLKFKVYSHWSNNGVIGPPPLPLIGNYSNTTVLWRSTSKLLQNVYEKYTEEKVVGLYEGLQPVLLIRDPDIVKHILIKDFNYFHDRGFKSGHSSPSLFSTEGDTWRILRQNLTPAFTSKKLKGIFPKLTQRCIPDFLNHIELLDTNIDHEIKSLTNKFTLDTITSCGLGFDVDVYSGTITPITEMIAKIFNPPRSVQLLNFVYMIFPILQKVISPPAVTGAGKFFVDAINAVLREREGKPKTKHDILDTLTTLKEQGCAIRRDENGLKEIEIDDNLIISQVQTFYVAGFEGSASAMAILLYELALNQSVQERLYKEICDVSNKYNGEIPYESLRELVYLQMTINEVLRKHTPAGVLLRMTTKDYIIPGTNILLEKGTPIRISPSGLHNDPKYFKNPDEFNPENFSPDNLKNIPQCAFLPFGAGPHNCIGKRFAETVTIVGIAAFLKKFKLIPSLRTKNLFEFEPKCISLKQIGGLWLKIQKRQ